MAGAPPPSQCPPLFHFALCHLLRLVGWTCLVMPLVTRSFSLSFPRIITKSGWTTTLTAALVITRGFPITFLAAVDGKRKWDETKPKSGGHGISTIFLLTHEECRGYRDPQQT